MAEFWKRERREEGETFKILAPKNTKMFWNEIPGKRVFHLPDSKLTFFLAWRRRLNLLLWKEFAQLGSLMQGKYIYVYIERRGVSSIGKIISHTLLSTRRDTKETNGVKKTETNKRKIDCLVIFDFIFIYFFDGLPRVPYEFLFPEPTLGMSVLLLGRGKVNDSPTPSRGFQIGDPSGLAAAGV